MKFGRRGHRQNAIDRGNGSYSTTEAGLVKYLDRQKTAAGRRCAGGQRSQERKKPLVDIGELNRGEKDSTISAKSRSKARSDAGRKVVFSGECSRANHRHAPAAALGTTLARIASRVTREQATEVNAQMATAARGSLYL